MADMNDRREYDEPELYEINLCRKCGKPLDGRKIRDGDRRNVYDTSTDVRSAAP
jgi:hypothetical protein